MQVLDLAAEQAVIEQNMNALKAQVELQVLNYIYFLKRLNYINTILRIKKLISFKDSLKKLNRFLQPHYLKLDRN